MNKMFELLRLMRPYQWVKNAFVFVGLLFGHAWHDAALVTGAVIAFAAFCLVSSAIYTFNDIVDLEQDKQHPKKSKRPLASGAVSITAAIVLRRCSPLPVWRSAIALRRRCWSSCSVTC